MSIRGSYDAHMETWDGGCITCLFHKTRASPLTNTQTQRVCEFAMHNIGTARKNLDLSVVSVTTGNPRTMDPQFKEEACNLDRDLKHLLGITGVGATASARMWDDTGNHELALKYVGTMICNLRTDLIATSVEPIYTKDLTLWRTKCLESVKASSKLVLRNIEKLRADAISFTPTSGKKNGKDTIYYVTHIIFDCWMAELSSGAPPQPMAYTGMPCDALISLVVRQLFHEFQTITSLDLTQFFKTRDIPALYATTSAAYVGGSRFAKFTTPVFNTLPVNPVVIQTLIGDVLYSSTKSTYRANGSSVTPSSGTTMPPVSSSGAATVSGSSSAAATVSGPGSAAATPPIHRPIAPPPIAPPPFRSGVPSPTVAPPIIPPSYRYGAPSPTVAPSPTKFVPAAAVEPRTTFSGRSGAPSSTVAPSSTKFGGPAKTSYPKKPEPDMDEFHEAFADPKYLNE
jgi:hypothetical protein